MECAFTFRLGYAVAAFVQRLPSAHLVKSFNGVSCSKAVLNVVSWLLQDTGIHQIVERQPFRVRRFSRG